MTYLESRDKAGYAAKAAMAKKAKDILILELRGLAGFTDYFVICSGESTTQVKAIAEHVEAEFLKKAIKPLSVEGLRYAHWALMDYGDVVVHVFEEGTRAYYELEKLWLDAPRIPVDEDNGMQAGMIKGKDGRYNC